MAICDDFLIFLEGFNQVGARFNIAVIVNFTQHTEDNYLLPGGLMLIYNFNYWCPAWICGNRHRMCGNRQFDNFGIQRKPSPVLSRCETDQRIQIKW